jgi:3-methyladenine DNA glycosylase AlkD
MFELVWGEEPKGKVLRQIAKAVKKNREMVLAEWEANVSQ